MSNGMKELAHLYTYDVVNGIKQRKRKYFIMLLAITLVAVQFWLQMRSYASAKNIDVKPGWLDYMMYMFRGMEVYIPGKDKKFEFPVIYMIFAVVQIMIIGDYAAEDIRRQGVAVITRVTDRCRWYISKVLWNITSVIMIYGSSVLISLILSCGRGGFLYEIMGKMFSINLGSGVTERMLAVTLLLLPFLTAVAIGQLQMVLSLVISPIGSMAAVLGLHVASAYSFHIWLIGNCSMIQRNRIVIIDGITSTDAIALDVAIMLASIIVGMVIIKRKDIL